MRSGAEKQNVVASAQHLSLPLDLSQALLSLTVGLFAWPFCYTCNLLFASCPPQYLGVLMVTVGTLMLAGVTGVIVKLSKTRDVLYYGWTLFMFTSMITAMISLEFNGLISGFIAFYLEFGEQYLKSPYGFAVALFDGFGFCLMYLVLILQLTNGKSWRSLGIYWASGLLTNMAVIIMGYLVGRLDFVPCAALNLPFVFFPAYTFIRAFKSTTRGPWMEELPGKSKFLNLVDPFLGLGLVYSVGLTIVKSGAVLGSELTMVKFFVGNEPSLLESDPAPYATFQFLMYFFYCLPIQLVTLALLPLATKPGYLWDLNLINAGIIFPGQICYIVAAVTEAYTNSNSSTTSFTQLSLTFWTSNVLLLVIPHLVLWRLSLHLQDGGVQSIRKNL